MRRAYGSLVVDTYVYLHNQRPERSITVRKQYYRAGKCYRSVHRAFSARQYGSLGTAIWHAIRWRNIRFGTPTRVRIRRAA